MLVGFLTSKFPSECIRAHLTYVSDDQLSTFWHSTVHNHEVTYLERFHYSADGEICVGENTCGH